MSKVNNKREKKIRDAIVNNNWAEVSHLLDQQLENALRRDRYYRTVSMNNKISYDEKQKEYGDNIADSTPSLLEQLIYQEEEQQLAKALLFLSVQEQKIVLGYYFDNKSYSELAKQTGLSDKTVKKRLESALQKMKEILQEEN